MEEGDYMEEVTEALVETLGIDGSDVIGEPDEMSETQNSEEVVDVIERPHYNRYKIVYPALLFQKNTRTLSHESANKGFEHIVRIFNNLINVAVLYAKNGKPENERNSSAVRTDSNRVLGNSNFNEDLRIFLQRTKINGEYTHIFHIYDSSSKRFFQRAVSDSIRMVFYKSYMMESERLNKVVNYDNIRIFLESKGKKKKKNDNNNGETPQQDPTEDPNIYKSRKKRKPDETFEEEDDGNSFNKAVNGFIAYYKLSGSDDIDDLVGLKEKGGNIAYTDVQKLFSSETSNNILKKHGWNESCDKIMFNLDDEEEYFPEGSLTELDFKLNSFNEICRGLIPGIDKYESIFTIQLYHTRYKYTSLAKLKEFEMTTNLRELTSDWDQTLDSLSEREESNYLITDLFNIVDKVMSLYRDELMDEKRKALALYSCMVSNQDLEEDDETDLNPMNNFFIDIAANFRKRVDLIFSFVYPFFTISKNIVELMNDTSKKILSYIESNRKRGNDLFLFHGLSSNTSLELSPMVFKVYDSELDPFSNFIIALRSYLCDSCGIPRLWVPYYIMVLFGTCSIFTSPKKEKLSFLLKGGPSTGKSHLMKILINHFFVDGMVLKIDELSDKSDSGNDYTASDKIFYMDETSIFSGKQFSGSDKAINKLKSSITTRTIGSRFMTIGNDKPLKTDGSKKRMSNVTDRRTYQIDLTQNVSYVQNTNIIGAVDMMSLISRFTLMSFYNEPGVDVLMIENKLANGATKKIVDDYDMLFRGLRSTTDCDFNENVRDFILLDNILETARTASLIPTDFETQILCYVLPHLLSETLKNFNLFHHEYRKTTHIEVLVRQFANLNAILIPFWKSDDPVYDEEMKNTFPNLGEFSGKNFVFEDIKNINSLASPTLQNISEGFNVYLNNYDYNVMQIYKNFFSDNSVEFPLKQIVNYQLINSLYPPDIRPDYMEHDFLENLDHLTSFAFIRRFINHTQANKDKIVSFSLKSFSVENDDPQMGKTKTTFVDPNYITMKINSKSGVRELAKIIRSSIIECAETLYFITETFKKLNVIRSKPKKVYKYMDEKKFDEIEALFYEEINSVNNEVLLNFKPYVAVQKIEEMFLAGEEKYLEKLNQFLFAYRSWLKDDQELYDYFVNYHEHDDTTETGELFYKKENFFKNLKKLIVKQSVVETKKIINDNISSFLKITVDLEGGDLTLDGIQEKLDSLTQKKLSIYICFFEKINHPDFIPEDLFEEKFILGLIDIVVSEYIEKLEENNIAGIDDELTNQDGHVETYLGTLPIVKIEEYEKSCKIHFLISEIKNVVRFIRDPTAVMKDVYENTFSCYISEPRSLLVTEHLHGSRSKIKLIPYFKCDNPNVKLFLLYKTSEKPDVSRDRLFKIPKFDFCDKSDQFVVPYHVVNEKCVLSNKYTAATDILHKMKVVFNEESAEYYIFIRACIQWTNIEEFCSVLNYERSFNI